MTARGDNTPGTRSPRTTRVRAVVMALLAVGAVACSTPTKSTASSASTPTSEGSSATTDSDEAIDPSAAGATPPSAASTASTSDPANCRSGDPLANVYHPTRLTVVQACITVTGTVASVRHEDDGDFHVNIDLDAAFANLINDRNVSGEHGALVVEIVPADEPRCTPGQPPKASSGTYDYGLCTGANEVAPNVGDRVAVTGPYVLDTAHGWMEVHPAWAITAA